MKETSLRPQRIAPVPKPSVRRTLSFRSLLALVSLALAAGALVRPAAAQTDAEKREQYIRAVVRGEGYMPWQAKDLSREEIEFRKQAEERKTRLLAERGPLQRPALLDAVVRDRLLRNLKSASWARDLAQAARQSADYLVAQPASYVAAMIGELTPWYEYGMTCPNCVGTKSQEGIGHGLLHWDYHDPDKLTCSFCGHVYPSARYAETQRLVCPRTGQTFTFYLNPKEQADPENRTGELAYHWVGHPMHMSFSGTVRWYKANFMIRGASDLALTWLVTGDARYARRAQEILVRLAVCYRNWLYHDYWNTVADAEPLYAAAHDTDLELVWKRHLATGVFEDDSLHRAAMEQTFWGGGPAPPEHGQHGEPLRPFSGFRLGGGRPGLPRPGALERGRTGEGRARPPP